MNDKGILPHLLSPKPQMGMFLLPALDLGIFRAYISAFHCKQANRFSQRHEKMNYSALNKIAFNYYC